MSEPEWKSLAYPEVNSRWDRPRLSSAGASTRTVRVMGYAEGYVIARLSGCIPFVVHISYWYRIYHPKIMPKRKRKGPAVTLQAGKTP